MVLTVVALDKVLFHDDFVSVTVPGSEGEMTILPQHMPLVSALSKGEIKIIDESNKEITFPIERGTIEIGTSGVTVLVD